MNYHLSPRIILDTMQALAAVQSMAGGEDERAILAPILSRERTPLLTVMIRNAFADIVMRLGPLVTDVDLGEEPAPSADAGSVMPPDGAGGADLLDLDLQVELLTPRGFTPGRHATIRRALEQDVALNALSMWSLAGTDTPAARGLADRFAAVAAGWHSTLTAALNPAFMPGITHRY